MARSFLVPITLNQQELQNARIQNLASAPGTPVAGQIYYDTIANFTLVYNGSAWVDARARANHSGTQLSATISDLAATVQAYRLNQFAVPNAAVAMGGFQITGLATSQTATGQAASWDWVVSRNLNTIATATAATANITASGFKLTNVGTPTTTGDAATYDWTLARPISAFAAAAGNVAMGGNQITGLATTQTLSGQAASYDFVIAQVQNAASGIASKPPVRIIAAANVGLTGLAAIDGVTPIAGDRVLAVAQTTTTQNGVYNAASGAWTRTTIDGAAPGEIEPGAMWLATEGTTYAGTQWRVATTGVITIGSTSLSIVQFGAASLYSAGNGLALTGGAFSVTPAAGGGLSVSGSGVAVDTAVVARKWSGTIGDGSSTSIIVTHSLGTQDVLLQCRQAATPYAVVDCDMSATSTTTATFAFAAAPASNAYRVTVVG